MKKEKARKRKERKKVFEKERGIGNGKREEKKGELRRREEGEEKVRKDI